MQLVKPPLPLFEARFSIFIDPSVELEFSRAEEAMGHRANIMPVLTADIYFLFHYEPCDILPRILVLHACLAGIDSETTVLDYLFQFRRRKPLLRRTVGSVSYLGGNCFLFVEKVKSSA